LPVKRAAIYMRVSTDSQTTENQRLATEQYCRLQNWKIVKVYEDVGISGAQDKRPDLDSLKADVAKGRYDVVLDMGPVVEPCALGLTPTASIAVMLAISDALALVVMERRGIGREDFGMRHHGGYLGHKARQG